MILSSSVPGAKTKYDYTDSSGAFHFNNVPQGAFSLMASYQKSMFGDAQGAIDYDGEAVELDVTLNANMVAPVSGVLKSLCDGNRMRFYVRDHGGIEPGTGNVFQGDGNFNRGAMRLSVEQGEKEILAKGYNASLEESGREIILPITNVQALKIERKVYVGAHNYFTRYVDSFTNKSDSTVSMTVHFDTHFGRRTQVIGGFTTTQGMVPVVTSSNNDLIGLLGPDEWVLLDDNIDEDHKGEGSPCEVRVMRV